MPASLAVRREAFAAFVRRALAWAHTARGWSVPEIARRAGIGNPTIYRWRDGSWSQGPRPDQVVAFCDALDIAPARAFEILWPGKGGDQVAEAEQPPPLDPDLAALARKLADPNLPESERYLLRESVRQLAARPVRPTADAPPVRRRRRGAAGG